MFVNDTKKWPELTLKGNSHVIPQVCPNCLGHAPLKFRYTHERIEQSFYYCESCATSLNEELNVGKRSGLFFLPVLFIGMIVFGILWFIPIVGLLFWLGLFEDSTNKNVSVAGILISVALGWYMVIVSIYYVQTRLESWIRGRAMRRFPKKEGQATWGRAAVCIEMQQLLSFGKSRYRAARAEWLQALAEANRPAVC